MLAKLLEFWSLSNPNVVWVLLGSALLGSCAGVIGCFTFLRKRSLVGDAMAHAALPGVTTAFIFFESRDPLVILLGATFSCFIGMFSIEYLSRNTKVKPDSALAIVLSVFFAVGIFQLTQIQKSPTAAKAGLDKLLFGQAASLVRSDVVTLSLIAFFVLSFVAIFFRKLKLISFDRTFAETRGVSIVFYDFMLALLVVLSVVIGLQLVGVVLIAALVLTPAASARYWSNNLAIILILAGLFGAFSGVVGANISYLAPQMPTGPWIVVATTMIFIVSMMFAPSRGIYSRFLMQKGMRHKIHDENTLRTLYKLSEDCLAGGAQITTVLNYRKMKPQELYASAKRLERSGFLQKGGDSYVLTENGVKRALELTRSHRLWELYLHKEVDMPIDHLHDDAEEIEHILTPDLEQQIVEEIGEEAFDPHGSKIPSVEEN